MERSMRAFIAAALAITMLTLPAYAQRSGGKRHQEQPQNAGQKKPKIDEKAYKTKARSTAFRRRRPIPGEKCAS
jgi:hypothetical protein